MNPSALISALLDRIREEADAAYLTNARLLRFINQAQYDVHAALVSMRANHELRKTATIDLVAEQAEYDLPYTFENLLRVEKLSGSKYHDIDVGHIKNVQRMINYSYLYCGWGQREQVAIENSSKLWIWPNPTAALTAGLRITYQARPPALFKTTVNDAAADATITIDDPTKSAFEGALEYRGQGYDGLKLYVSADTEGSAAGSEATINSINTLGTVITVESAITELGDNAVVEVVSPLPTAAMQALIAQAAWYYAEEEELPHLSAKFAAQFDFAMNNPRGGLLNLVKKRQTQRAGKIRRVR